MLHFALLYRKYNEKQYDDLSNEELLKKKEEFQENLSLSILTSMVVAIIFINVLPKKIV